MSIRKDIPFGAMGSGEGGTYNNWKRSGIRRSRRRVRIGRVVWI